MERIIVGVDGSPTATTALRWAAAHARERGASLEALHAWHVTYGEGKPPDEVAAQERARATLDATIAAAGVAGLVKQVLVRAIPASALLDASRGADLLVVGASAAPQPRLGTVSAQVVPSAHCPVVVIPAY